MVNVYDIIIHLLNLTMLSKYCFPYWAYKTHSFHVPPNEEDSEELSADLSIKVYEDPVNLQTLSTWLFSHSYESNNIMIEVAFFVFWHLYFVATSNLSYMCICNSYFVRDLY